MNNWVSTLALLAASVGSACSQPASDPVADGAGDKAPNAAVAPAEAVAPAQDDVCGRVLFVSSREQVPDQIWQVPAAGGPITELTRDGPATFPAAISPDGRSLLALRSEPLPNGKTRDRFALAELASLGPGAATLAALGPEDAALRNPSWSPDGGWIVFESDADSFRDLYRLELGSGVSLRLTDNPEGNFEPAVSPDGQRIAFVSSRDGNAEVYVMTADGGEPIRVTDSPGDDTAPVWSPDGQTIAFRSARDRARGVDLFLTGPDQDPNRGVQLALRDGSPPQSVIASGHVYSPDGSLLAFTQLIPKAGAASIVIVRPSTGELVARTDAAGIDEQPAWSPDGKHLVFARTQGQHSDIARMRADGSELELLTKTDGLYWLPRWVAEPQCPRVAPIVTPTPGQG